MSFRGSAGRKRGESFAGEKLVIVWFLVYFMVHPDMLLHLKINFLYNFLEKNAFLVH